jgi:thymidylate kinase
VISALDAAPVRWLLLREPTEADVDLLIHPDDSARAQAALAAAGFAAVPSWGRGSHTFWRRYDPVTDAWCTLDVVHQVAFGASGELRTPLAAACLDRVAVTGGLPRPAPADELWLLLLHCLYDRPCGRRNAGTVDLGRHAHRVRELAGTAPVEGPVVGFIDAAVGPVLREVLRGRAAAGDTAALTALAPLLRQAWPHRSRAAARRVTGTALRHSTKLLVATRRPGITVALLGPDGAGKSTTAAGVAAALPLPTRRLYGGHYGGAKRHAGTPAVLVRQLCREAQALWHRRRGRVVLYDRHAADALLPPRTASRRAALRRALLAYAARPADLYVVLDAGPQLLHRRSGEHDVVELARQRAAYADLAGRLPGAVVVDGEADPDAVRRVVTGHLWRRLTERWGTAPTPRANPTVLPAGSETACER